MVYYTITYLNPYIFKEMKNINIFHLKSEEVDTFYKIFKPYYNIRFTGKIATINDSDDNFVEEIFKLSNRIKENPTIPNSQLPFRSIGANDIITIHDDNGDRSYFYGSFDHFRMSEVVL